MDFALQRLQIKMPARKRHYSKPNLIIGSPFELQVCKMLKQGSSCLQIYKELRFNYHFYVSYDRVLEYKEYYFDRQHSGVVKAIRSAQSHIDTCIDVEATVSSSTMTRAEQLTESIQSLDKLIEKVESRQTKNGWSSSRMIGAYMGLIKTNLKFCRELDKLTSDQNELKNLKGILVDEILKLVREIILPVLPRDQATETLLTFDKAIKNL